MIHRHYKYHTKLILEYQEQRQQELNKTTLEQSEEEPSGSASGARTGEQQKLSESSETFEASRIVGGVIEERMKGKNDEHKEESTIAESILDKDEDGGIEAAEIDVFKCSTGVIAQASAACGTPLTRSIEINMRPTTVSYQQLTYGTVGKTNGHIGTVMNINGPNGLKTTLMNGPNGFGKTLMDVPIGIVKALISTPNELGKTLPNNPYGCKKIELFFLNELKEAVQQRHSLILSSSVDPEIQTLLDLVQEKPPSCDHCTFTKFGLDELGRHFDGIGNIYPCSYRPEQSTSHGPAGHQSEPTVGGLDVAGGSGLSSYTDVRYNYGEDYTEPEYRHDEMEANSSVESELVGLADVRMDTSSSNTQKASISNRCEPIGGYASNVVTNHDGTYDSVKPVTKSVLSRKKCTKVFLLDGAQPGMVGLQTGQNGASPEEGQLQREPERLQKDIGEGTNEGVSLEINEVNIFN